jgi:2-succinyl-6-hydroxy-2,4-cyclohexadiene-1-carboxylate synthase
MPTVSVNGLDLHYRDVGTGYPVVLVHGFTGNTRNWALTVPALRERFRCVSVDLRGHGRSARPAEREEYALEVMAGDVVGLLEQLGIRECYLVGHSMGGMVAQQIAIERPRLVGALVLVDTAAEVPKTLVYAARVSERERLIDIARTQGMEAVFDEQLRMNPQREMLEANEDFVRTWREQFLMTSPDAYVHCAHGLAHREPLLDELRNVTAPTLIICGVSDEPFVEPSRRMHEAIPRSELVMLAGAGHSPQIEAPVKFNEVLLGFLSRVQDGVGARG